MSGIIIFGIEYVDSGSIGQIPTGIVQPTKKRKKKKEKGEE